MAKNVLFQLPPQLVLIDTSSSPATSQATAAAAQAAGQYAGWTPLAYDVVPPVSDITQCAWNAATSTLVVDVTRALKAMASQVAQRIDALMDLTASQWGYQDAKTLAGYATDPHPLWAHQAQAFIVWRSSVWVQVYADQAAVLAGTQAPPASVEAYMATLPAAPAEPVV